MKCAPTWMIENIHDLFLEASERKAEKTEANHTIPHSFYRSLIFLSPHSRPDLAFSIEVLSRFLESLFAVHRRPGKRIVR